MRVTELRIGNLVAFNYNWDVVCTVEEIQQHSVRVSFDTLPNLMNGLTTHPDNYISIPLTEEWLLKFGFEKLTDKKNGFNSNSYTYTKGISFIVHLNDKLLSVNFWQGNEKKYVHELQNLFFALTGEELTI